MLDRNQSFLESFSFGILGFSKFLQTELSNSPKLINLEVTKLCNARCDFCDYWQTKHEERLDDYTNVIDKIGPLVVMITGGEPMLRKDIVDIVRQVKSASFFTYTGIITKGDLLDLNKAKQLYNVGLDQISISLDFLGDRHSVNRGVDAVFKEDGNTIEDTEISNGQSKPLALFITIGSQASYNADGDSFEVLAAKIGDDTINARQPITVFLKLTDGFDLSSVKYKENLEPGESFTFQLNLENNANGDDEFTLSALSVPSGWRVVFPEGPTYSIDAGGVEVIPIQVTVSDDARNGDEESITISISSKLSNIEKQQSFVVEVEQGFTDRLASAFSDLWYVFVFLLWRYFY